MNEWINSVICTDKTGTLTKGQMTAVRMWTQSKTFRITGQGYDPTVINITNNNNQQSFHIIHCIYL